MEHKKIVIPSLSFFQNELKGEGVVKSRRTLGELTGIFENQDAYSQLPLDQLAYEVYSYLPEREGTPGGLYFGITQLYPGKVGDEYFMTKGHFHQQEDRSEYYWGLEGEGMLILMDRERNTWAERMMPGSLHYIPGGVAHRVANTGNSVLSFAACWPSDAGHNYVHDSAKELPRQELLQIFADNAIIAENAPARPSPVWHGIAAAILAETQWGITDPEILSAIRCHTTGKPGMSKLDKIIYLADMTSAERDWPGVDDLRALEMQDLDRALCDALKRSIDFVEEKGGSLDPESVAAYEYAKAHLE